MVSLLSDCKSLTKADAHSLAIAEAINFPFEVNIRGYLAIIQLVPTVYYSDQELISISTDVCMP